MWGLIKDGLDANYRDEIQKKLDGGADGIEHALDLLDDGGVADLPHRHAVTESLASYFTKLTPPLDHHAAFLRRLSSRQEKAVPVFSLNYDPLLERASTPARARVIDGFVGFDHAYFSPTVFLQRTVTPEQGLRHRQGRSVKGILHLYKLHGSMGWYLQQGRDAFRGAFDAPVPQGTARLMVPPQRRKAADTTAPPYASLWSDFRRYLAHGPELLHRLACIGYGMRDEHVNAVIENGLARTDFTVMVFAKNLDTAVFTRWHPKPRVILVTEDRCSLDGEVGVGHPNLWSFEKLSTEI